MAVVDREVQIVDSAAGQVAYRAEVDLSLSASATNIAVSTSDEDKLTFEDGIWTVVNPETGIFGSGESPEAAYEDFEHALLGHLRVLREDEALSPGLSASLEYLQHRLRVD